MDRPDFSPFAARYARFRPSYPDELFEFLALLVNRHACAWDCATGNGQAAVGLAEHFRHVVATDVSSEQIEHARPHARIEYRVAPAEASGLRAQSADLVTVAAALHWFDLESFFSEVRRVLRPGGVLAAWTYHAAVIEGPIGEIIGPLYWDLLKDYFASGARLVDDRYASLSLPGEPLAAPEFFMTAAWTLDELRGFVESWSGTQRYMKERGVHPFAGVAPSLTRLWGDPDQTREIRWPLFMHVSRF